MESVREATDSMQVLKKIRRMVDLCLGKSTTLDVEAIASDIWLELWENDKLLCWTHVRNRCIDAIRHHMKVLIVSLESIDEAEWGNIAYFDEEENPVDARETLNVIMQAARERLTGFQQQLVYQKFYVGYTNADIAKYDVADIMTEEAVKKRLQAVMQMLRTVARELVEEGVIENART